MYTECHFFRRNLPHLHPPQGTFFLTFCLMRAMPREKMLKLRSEMKIDLKVSEIKAASGNLALMKINIEKIYFDRLDTLMAQSKTNAWLENRQLAEIISEKMKEFDGKRYRLLSYCIMPNHVHMLIEQEETYTDHGEHQDYLSTTLNLLKGSTARFCNIALHRTGPFWQDESYDHLVRDGRELFNICQYIINNPVKAGFVNEWHEWPFVFLSEKCRR